MTLTARFSACFIESGGQMATTTRNENRPSQSMPARRIERPHFSPDTHAEKHESGSWQTSYAERQYAPYGNSIAQFEKYRKEH
jgi:hypothetical protein